MFSCQWFSSHWVEGGGGHRGQRQTPDWCLDFSFFSHLTCSGQTSRVHPNPEQICGVSAPPQEEAAGKHTHMTDATALVILQDTWPENTPLPSRSSSPTSGLGDPSHPNSKCPPHFRYGKMTHPAWGACLPHPTLPVNPPRTWAHHWEEPGATNMDDEVSR